MFKGVNRVIYRVQDLEKGKQWYRQVLEAEPVFDSPVAVIFDVGSSALILVPNAETQAVDGNVIAGWSVDDAIVSSRRLCELGATPVNDISTFAGMRTAALKDPFGNVFAVVSPVEDVEKTIERKPSDTARGVATLRFFATMEEREEIRGRDYLAEIFLPEETKTLARDSAKREWILTKFFPPGLYRSHIARTAYFDQKVEEAFRAGTPQVVFLGAGYDSRSYRFADLITDTRVFEVDSPMTQEHKKELLDRAGIAIPKSLVFVPIDFTKESLNAVLSSRGFDQGQKTIFIWEGVTYYLPEQAIDGTLSFIRENSSPGSVVCFDYHSTFPGVDEAYGMKEILDFMKANAPGERLVFRIEREKIEDFLSERGYALIEHLTSEQIEKRFLTLKDGSSAGRIPASTCYVQAMVK